MPIYEYTCEKCGTRIDVLQKMDEPAPAKCANCAAEGTMARQVSRTSFVLKGGGWYSDLYGSAKKDTGTGTASTSTATPATPAAASDSTKKDSGGTGGSSGGSTPPASGGTPSSSGGTSGSSASPA